MMVGKSDFDVVLSEACKGDLLSLPRTSSLQPCSKPDGEKIMADIPIELVDDTPLGMFSTE